MAKYRVTAPDGASFEITAPDDATPQQVQAYAEQQFQAMRPGLVGRAADGGVVGGIKQGLRDPIDAGAQLLRRIVPEPVAQAVDAAGNWLADQGLPVARSQGVAGVDKIVRDSGQQYEADRKAAGRDGIDGARLLGNVANPVNLAMPSAAGASTVRALAARGAAAGALGAGLQPVVDGQADFWSAKAGQMAAGALAGGVLTPALAKGAEKAGTALAQRAADRAQPTVVIGGQFPGVTRANLDAAVGRLIESQGMRLQDAPKVVLDSVRRQLTESLAGGRRLDAGAALRMAEAEALGLTGDAGLTLGQATRNPMQWAQERNLSGVVINTPRGPSNPMADRLASQNRALGRVFSGADDALDKVTGAEVILGGAQAGNRRADNSVRAAYDAFRQATGRELDVPLQGLAQDYAATLETFGEAIPAAVRRQFEALGLIGGTQRRGLTIDGAERLIKVLNANTDPANRPAFRALGELRGAVERAITNAADVAPDGAAAEAAMLAKEARGVAAGVFQTRREIPALQAALNDVAPDRFVDRFLVNAPTREAAGLMTVLREDPAAMHQAQAQVLRHLQRAAFGENLAGDAPIAADRYARELARIGPQKLRAILGEDMAVRLTLAAKVAAEINTMPVGAKNAVNNSGTGAAVFNLLQRVLEAPGVRQIPLARGLSNQVGEIANERAVQAALATPQASAKPAAELSPVARRAIGRLFTPAALTFGAGSGSGQ